jgi:hypothetical protein
MGLLFGYAAFDDNANIVSNSRAGFLCGDIFQVDIVVDVDDKIFHFAVLYKIKVAATIGRTCLNTVGAMDAGHSADDPSGGGRIKPGQTVL